MLLVRRLGG